jgi:hypothetical protein
LLKKVPHFRSQNYMQLNDQLQASNTVEWKEFWKNFVQYLPERSQPRDTISISVYPEYKSGALTRKHWLLLFFNYALQPLRLIVRSGLHVPTFATRCLHVCHQARAPIGGKWNCGREISGNYA